MPNTTATDDKAQEILTQEYLQLQRSIEDFDAKALTIKAWSVTLSAAGIVTAYVETAPMILLIASASALIFWIVEALWKTNQQAFYERVYEIERHFGSPGSPTQPLRIAGSWSESWHRHGGARLALRVMWWWHVLMPHVAVSIAGIFLFLFWPPTPTL